MPKAILSLREHQKRAQRGDTDNHFTEGTLKAMEAIVKRLGSFENIESFKEFRRFAYQNFQKLGEATPGSAFGQLFRAGVQTSTNGWYERTEVEYEKYTMMDTTNKRQEFWAPLWGSQFPNEVAAGEPYAETTVLGQDIEFIPRKFMGGESFTREMFDDDQTGQIKQRMRNLGEAARLREELEMAGRLANTSITYGNATVAKTLYARKNNVGATVGAFDNAFYGTRAGVNYGNRLSAFAQLSMQGIRSGLSALKRAFDPLGIPLAVRPDVLVVSPEDDINARTLMNSSLYPGVQGRGGETMNTAASGFAVGLSADNMLKGMLDLAGNVFLPPWAWNIGCKGKGLMFVRRDPLEVVQEGPNSGKSFDSDVIRFRSRSRYRGDWNDAMFWFQGNDGSVAGTQ